MELLEACELIVDCPHSTAKDEGEGYPLIRTPNVGRGRLILDNVHRVSESVYHKRNERAVPQEDDLILAREAPVGNVAIIRQGQNVCLGQRTVLIRPDRNIVDPEYLVYYLLSPGIQHVLLNSANGATVSHLNMSDIRKLEISLPPLIIQRKIGHTLSSIDDRIAINDKINQNLSEQIQTIYKCRFGDRIANGDISDSWKTHRLDEVCSMIVKGITPKYNDESDQFVINQKCIRNHEIDLSLARRHIPKTINDKWLQYGDLLINSTGEGTLGRAAQVLFAPANLTVDSHVTIVRPKSPELIEYIGIWGITHEYDFTMMSTGSTGQTDLPRERLKAMNIVVPSQRELIDFKTTIKPMNDKVILNQQENVHLAKARDILLPKLMSGELDISGIEL